MSLVVTGCRDWTDRDDIRRAIEHHRHNHEAIHVGDCPTGVDAIVRADYTHVIVHRADWSRGRGGGPRRNRAMLDDAKPTLVLAFWDGKSRGTLDCISAAIERGLHVLIYPKAER